VSNDFHQFSVLHVNAYNIPLHYHTITVFLDLFGGGGVVTGRAGDPKGQRITGGVQVTVRVQLITGGCRLS
jgi:hypothetical protein